MFRIGIYLTDDLIRIFQNNGKIIFGFTNSFLQFFLRFFKGIQFHTGKAVYYWFS